jgi:phosphatidylserine/phosphatidylglycerophosphate/cardiolipin synthase-like enzyme
MLRGQPGIQIRVKGSRELMHLKAYLIDGSLLREGSANWSPSGLKRQDNNAYFTTDPAQVAAFQQVFEQMWTRGDNERMQ